ncbi:hypothetical protein F443_01548, partial [Phytophthora nicotianae P1569]
HFYVVAKTTSALVCQLPANNTAVCQPLDVGVMGPLKKKITTFWVAETHKSTKGKCAQCGLVKNCNWDKECRWQSKCVCCALCGLGEDCECWNHCQCWDECLCGVACLCSEECMCVVDETTELPHHQKEERKKPAAKRKKQNQARAEEYRRSPISRIIKAWRRFEDRGHRQEI